VSIFIFSVKKKIFQVAFCSKRAMAKKAQMVGNLTMRGYHEVTLGQITAKTDVLLRIYSNMIKEAKHEAGEQGENLDLCAWVILASKLNTQKGWNAALTAKVKRNLVEIMLSDNKHCHMTYGQLVYASRRTLLYSSIVYDQYRGVHYI